MARMEIVSGVERRRRWSNDQKLRIVAEADEPGARIGEVAGRHDIHPSQIRMWRRSFCRFGAPAAFVPVNIIDHGQIRRIEGQGGPLVTKAPMIVVSLRNGRSLKAPADLDRRTLTSLIQCVEAA